MMPKRCGTICYEVFKTIADQHSFPPDVPSAEVTIGLLSKLIANPRVYAVVAEIDHQVVGSNFRMSGRRLQESVRSRSIRLRKIGDSIMGCALWNL
jgi:hypothetical protein